MDTDIFMTSEQHFRILIPSDFQAFIEEFQKTSTSFLLKKLSQIKRFFFFFFKFWVEIFIFWIKYIGIFFL